MAARGESAARLITLDRFDVECFVVWLEEIQAATHILDDIQFSQIYHNDTKSDRDKRRVVREGLQHVIGRHSARMLGDLRKALRPAEKTSQLQPIDGGRA